MCWRAAAIYALLVCCATARILSAGQDVAQEQRLPDRTARPQQIFGVGNATWVGTPRVVSWQPLATVYDAFLSDAECDYLLNISRPLMEPAMLVNNKRQQHVRSASRTSRGAFHDSFGDPVLAMITHRIAHVARVPPGNLEPWQVMAYGPEGQYTRHVDYYDRDSRFFGNDVTKFGGQRVMTALLYLTRCTGGETVFRKAPANDVGTASCQNGGAGVEAVRGAMVIFHDTLPSGDVDPLTSHLSCPVKEGEKVVVSRFIRQDTCYLNRFFSWRKWNGNIWCEDDHTRCTEWAAKGYCDSQDSTMRAVMLGDDVWPGFCERSCGQCRPLEDTVVALRKELQQDIPAAAVPTPEQVRARKAAVAAHKDDDDDDR